MTSELKLNRFLAGDTTFQCTYCDKGFPLKIQLISHTRSHTGDLKNEAKEFKLKFVLKGEKPHKCSECDKKYSHKIDLKRHMMLHSGIKAYKW